MQNTNTAAPPLAGIRVIDMGHIVAGPMVGAILGDFGADVIKIENPLLHDSLRELLKNQDGIGLWSKVEDRNKRPITLNLKTDEGKAIMWKLLATADVLVDNYRADTLSDLGFSDALLAERCPRLVVCHISGWGSTGPFKLRSAYGRIAEATAGFAHLNGDAAGPPMHSAMSLGDTVASIWSAYGISLALRARDRDGKGQVVDVGLYEPLFRQIETQVIAYDQKNVVLGRQASRNPTAPTAMLYATRDKRWYTVGTATPRSLQAVIDIAGLARFPNLATPDGVMDHIDEYHERLSEWMLERDAMEIDRLFAAGDGPGAPVLSVDQMLVHPQIVAREMVITVPDEELGPIRMPGVVPKLLRTPGEVRHAGRAAGSANAEVYGELGLNAEDLARLKNASVI